jgi:integrase
MRRHPNGFPHVKNSPVRKAINNRLRALQTDVNEDNGDIYKTLHCLRHTFKDRLRATNAREEMIDAIMGHANKKPKYGDIDLDAKLAIMNQLVFA